MGDFDIEAWKAIVAELSIGVTGVSLRDCIRTYDPSMPTSMIKKSLNKFNVHVLFNTLKYLTPGRLG